MWSRFKNLVLQLAHTGNNNDEWFGTNIKFYDLYQGLSIARKFGKPVMIVVHHEMCEACKKFRPLIANSPLVKELSVHFVMVGIEEETAPDTLRIDGKYTPRVIFLNSSGYVEKEFYNRLGNPRHKYFYHSDKSVIRTMKEVLMKYPPGCPGDAPCYFHT